MIQKIAIKFCNGIVVYDENRQQNHPGYSLTFISQLMAHGFMPTMELADALSELSTDDITSLYRDVMPCIKKLVGANVIHKPMYPNFPKQVMEADDQELYINALAHYWSHGTWMPNFVIEDRSVSFEDVKFKTLGLVTEADVDNVFTKILQSADSISESSKEVIEWFVESGRNLNVPDNIPFKENICVLAGLFLKHDIWDSNLVKDTTDVLRIVTYLNGGDVSLAENTKFKSLPRKTRKLLVKELERVANEEDFARHAGKWVKLLHNLHVGDYSKPLFDMAKKLRENIKIETFNGKLENAMQNNDIDKAVALAMSRPGIFSRNLTRLISLDSSDKVINSFKKIVDDVPVRNLTQLWGSLKTRTNDIEKRVVFPKGMTQQAYVLRNHLARLPENAVSKIINIIKNSLITRFEALGELGNVYIDPNLYNCPLPSGMRSASEGLREVARGTRLPFGNKNTLRFFIYWKGEDIDLSATMHDEHFGLVDHVSYTQLRGDGYKACHSGDITSAPDGASEFIDIDIESVLQNRPDIRYVAMNVYVYRGPTFAEHEECFAGWMTRDAPNSNEIYEPKTVQQKIDLRSATKSVIPVMFDLVDRQAIWCDIATSHRMFSNSHTKYGSNNVENNKATTQDMVEAFVSLDNKITLGELFELHTTARGLFIDNKEEADFVFDISDGDITPYDVTRINAEFL